MIKPEKAAYSRLALNEGLKQLKAVHLTAARKNCYYPIYSNLNEIKNWLEDYGGNRHAFYCYHLEDFNRSNYRPVIARFDNTTCWLSLAACTTTSENILSIFREGEAGNVDIV